MNDFENIPPESLQEDASSACLKGKRRSKTDPEGRSFLCGCGKNYLSYPALYTHVKNKHGGSQPQGTLVPNARSTRIRGRPRKLPDFRPSSYFQDKGYFGGPADPRSGFCIIEGSEPKDVLYVHIRRLVKEPETQVGASCNEALAGYLVAVAQEIKPEFYRQFVLFAQCLRRCLNQHGWELPGESPIAAEYCEIRGPDNLPHISNIFVSDFLPQECPSLDRRAAIEMTLHLNRWLCAHNLSRLALNPLA